MSARTGSVPGAPGPRPRCAGRPIAHRVVATASVPVLVALGALGGVGMAAGPATAGTTDASDTAASMRPAARGTGQPGYCADDRGVTVVVDFSDLGGDIVVRCVPGRLPPGFTGLDALQQAGYTLEGTVQYGLNFICRIEGRPSADETLSFGGREDYREDCDGTPPGGAYWSYWQAENGGAWEYSKSGVATSRVTDGMFQGWAFSLDKQPGSNTQPGVRPYRPGSTTDPTTDPTPTTTQPTRPTQTTPTRTTPTTRNTPTGPTRTTREPTPGPGSTTQREPTNSPGPTQDTGRPGPGGEPSPTGRPQTGSGQTTEPTGSTEPTTPGDRSGAQPTDTVESPSTGEPGGTHPGTVAVRTPTAGTPTGTATGTLPDSTATTAPGAELSPGPPLLPDPNPDDDVDVTGDLPSDPPDPADGSTAMTLIGAGTAGALALGAFATAWQRRRKTS